MGDGKSFILPSSRLVSTPPRQGLYRSRPEFGYARGRGNDQRANDCAVAGGPTATQRPGRRIRRDDERCAGARPPRGTVGRFPRRTVPRGTARVSRLRVRRVRRPPESAVAVSRVQERGRLGAGVPDRVTRYIFGYSSQALSIDHSERACLTVICCLFTTIESPESGVLFRDSPFPGNGNDRPVKVDWFATYWWSSPPPPSDVWAGCAGVTTATTWGTASNHVIPLSG